MNQITNIPSRLDNMGIFCSGLCMAHCLLVPVLALFSPAIASFFESEWIHKGLVIIVAPIALMAFITGKKTHGKVLPIVLGLFGVSTLILAVLSESIEGVEISETIVTVIGSIMLIIAHILNLRLMNLARKQ